MQINLKNLSEKAAAAAQKFGAADARIIVSRKRQNIVSRSGRQLDELWQRNTMSLSASIFVDGRYAGYATSDLRPEALETFLKNAVAMTRVLEPDPAWTLPPAELYQGYTPPDLRVLDPGFEQVQTDWRKKIALTLEEVSAKQGDLLSQIEAYYDDQREEYALINTNGFAGEWQATSFGFGVTLSAPDRNGAMASYSEDVRARIREGLPRPEDTASFALERVLKMRGSKPIKTGAWTMIVENRAAPRLIGLLIEPMLGASLQQRRSFLEGKKGKAIASPRFSMIDDPLLPGGLGSRPADAEGIPAKKRAMIEGGVLKEFFVDVYYANKLNWKPTTGSYANLTFGKPGDKDLAGLIKQAGKGILVTGFLGGNSNALTGDFSVGVEGFYFERGEIVKPVKEMNIADNHLKFWRKLKALGHDPYQYSNVYTPSMMFEDIVFSGTGQAG